ncbi:MAG: hypothetical protein K8F91_10970, partial [Candidatus Obscuribacterales bacterium]|nr:hypothetical protein [Candidatus Obscuribacterales bacterium]
IVVRELFATAEHTVLLSGYAVYQGQIVFEALANRMEELPTLQVRLFLDVHRPSGDSREPQVLVERFRTQFLKYQWPLNKPIPEVFYYPSSLELDSSKRSVLHAKCIVVDENHVFVSSANFTEAAQERNIEIGLAFKSPEIAKRIIWHFSALLDEGILVPLFNVR